MRIVLLRASLAASFVLAGQSRPTLAAVPVSSCAVVLPAHVRVLDCQLAAAVATGLMRSSTLRRQFERILELQGIVYVATSRHVAITRKTLRGALSHHVAVSGAICVLRITLAYNFGNRAVGSLAHELHHAIEVLEHPEARTEAAIADLFDRIGVSVGYGAYETQDAIATQLTVLRELHDWRRPARQ